MTELSEDHLARLRAFANKAPESAPELNEALRYVRLACPDFAFSGTGISRHATLTLHPGPPIELSGRTYGDLLAQAARRITGVLHESEERRRGK
ncbi:MAG: hypothetical protein ABIP93_17675 [Gemmatimonadaceae bacterium]